MVSVFCVLEVAQGWFCFLSSLFDFMVGKHRKQYYPSISLIMCSILVLGERVVFLGETRVFFKVL